MLKWIFHNTNRIFASSVLLMNILTACIGFTVMRKRKAGLPPEVPQWLLGGLILLAVLVCIFIVSGTRLSFRS